MSDSPDITVTAVFHREDALALPALASMRDMVDAARATGLIVEARAILDRPDDLTRQLIVNHGAWLCGVEEISVGDLGLARNAGVRAARGEFVAFLDGDDLWGADWLHLAHSAAHDADDAIWHPECLYHFCDFGVRNPYVPIISVMGGSDAPEFDRDVNFFGNLWSANAFARRAIYLRHPYRAVDRNRGFGVEDWSWNIETLFAGIPHRIVPDTVHLIRTKENGSLHRQNVGDGLLPYLPADAWPRLGEERSEALLRRSGIESSSAATPRGTESTLMSHDPIAPHPDSAQRPDGKAEASKCEQECDLGSLLEVRPLDRDIAMYVTPRHPFHHLVQDHERFTADLICRISRRAGLFVDVGAHHGFFSLLAASSNRALDVIAVEPAPDTFAVLEQNLATLATDRVTPCQAAISDRVGTKSFGISSAPENCGFYFRPETPPLRWIDVTTKSLDALLFDRKPCPLVIKIDTRGHELAVVRGMSETLRRFNETTLIVKFDPAMLRAGGNQPAALLEELDRLGFETFLIDDRARQTFRLRPSGDWERLLGQANSGNLYCVRKDRALSLCFFAHSAELGGAERSMLGLIEELVTNHGAVCCVIVPGQGAFAQALEAVGATCIIVQYQWWCALEQLTGNERGQRVRQGIESIFADIIPQIKKIDPDCIWTMTMVIPWGAMIAGMLAKPHVWSVHEYGEKDHGLKFFWPLDQISADIVASSSLVYVVSKGIAAALFPTIPEDRLRPFPYSITVPPASDGDGGWEFFKDGKSIKLGVFASLHPSKGQEDAILALARLVARGHNVELLLAGLTADQSYRERLSALGRKLKVAERVHFSGFLVDPYRAMRSCDIMVVCSRNEAFGRVAVEAMLLEKPVVYAAAGGLMESMIDGQTGLSYPPTDIQSLAAALEELIGNPARRKAIGEFSHRHAVARFGRGAGGREIFGNLLELRSQAAPKVFTPKLLEESVFNTIADSITELRRTIIQRDELRAELRHVSEDRDHWQADAEELRISREEVRVQLKKVQAELSHWQRQSWTLNNLATYASERYAAANLTRPTKAVGFCVRLFRRLRSKLRLPSSVPSRAYYAVRDSIFFDAAFYSNEYPDVEATGTDPIVHYILHGGFEGRNPGPYFSSSKYLDENPGVAAIGLNPLVHYELNGRKEGRALPLVELSSSA